MARLHVGAVYLLFFDMCNAGLGYSWLPPYMLIADICGQPISMELDTEASVSAMATTLLKCTFPKVCVDVSGVMLRIYYVQLAPVEVQAPVSVRIGNREVTLPPYVTKGSPPTLWGRNWIPALRVWLKE